jgi:hypothetical protein
MQVSNVTLAQLALKPTVTSLLATLIAKTCLGQFVEQKNRELIEQKNTIPKGLNSYNFGNGLDYEKIGSKPRKRAQLSRQKLSAIAKT